MADSDGTALDEKSKLPARTSHDPILGKQIAPEKAIGNLGKGVLEYRTPRGD